MSFIEIIVSLSLILIFLKRGSILIYCVITASLGFSVTTIVIYLYTCKSLTFWLQNIVFFFKLAIMHCDSSKQNLQVDILDFNVDILAGFILIVVVVENVDHN